MLAPRIASLLTAGTEILYALGLGERVVAVSHECDYPPEAAAKPRVTRTRVDAERDSAAIDRQVREMRAADEPLYEIDIAKLIELRPDLIITQKQCEVCAVSEQDVLRALGRIPSDARTAVLDNCEILALNPTSLRSIFDDIIRVGRAAGCPERAEQYCASLRQRIAHVKSGLALLPFSARVRVVCIEWIEPLMLAGNWMPELIEIAGGRCELIPPGRRSAGASWSEVVEYNPDAIIIAPCGFDLPRTMQEAPALAALPGWSDLRAIHDRCVYAVDGNAYFNRSGPRLIDSLEILASLLHPDRFCGQYSVYDHAWREFVP